MRLGDWSTSGDSSYYITRSSDFLIDHFRAFKTATGDSAWDTIRTAHQNLITSQQNTYASGTGLLADFIVNTNTTPKPAAGNVLEGANDGFYYWNACRDPWRIGTDAITSGDAASLASARKLNSWIKSKTGGNAGNIVTGYKLNGTALESGHDMAFTAPFVVTAMTDPGSQAWLDAIWAKLRRHTGRLPDLLRRERPAPVDDRGLRKLLGPLTRHGQGVPGKRPAPALGVTETEES